MFHTPASCRYWVPLPYQTTAAGFIQMVEDTRTIMAGDKSFSVITKENGYGFKNPVTFLPHDLVCAQKATISVLAPLI